MTGVDQMIGVKVQRGLGTYLIPVLVNDNFDKVSDPFLCGPRREKTCLRGFRQSEIQTSLLSYRD